MLELFKTYTFLTPLSIFLGSILFGFIFDKLILSRIKKIASQTAWEGDDIIIAALEGVVFKFSWPVGLYLTLLFVNLPTTATQIINKLLISVIILIATLTLSKIAVDLVESYGRKNKAVWFSSSILTNLTKYLIVSLGILIILQSLGISITPLITALGVGGLAVALAFQETLANLFAGLHIIISRQINIGDYIKISTSDEGYVTDITWRNTTIKSINNNLIVIPNSSLASATIMNMCLPEKPVTFTVPVGVNYASDLSHVEKITLEVAKEVLAQTPGAVSSFIPKFYYRSFGDFSINFTIALQAAEFAHQAEVTHAFIKKLHARFEQEKIDIPYPIRTVYNKGQA